VNGLSPIWGHGRRTSSLALRICASRFSWGFTINRQDITFARPEALEPQDWDSHLDLLRTSYPDRIFDRHVDR
jgi:hypothetical protein